MEVLSNIIDIKVPIDGELVQIEKITDVTVGNESYNKVIWQIPRCSVIFKDNQPVKLCYDIGDETDTLTLVSSLKSDVMYLVPIGNISLNDQILKGFSPFAYARTPFYIDWTQTNSFELLFKIKTGNTVNVRQKIFSMTKTDAIELEILSGKLHWKLTDSYSAETLDPKTDYWIKVNKNLADVTISYSVNGSDFKTVIVSQLNKSVKNEYMHLGIDKVTAGMPIEQFYGEFDLTQCQIIYNDIRYKVKMQDDAYITLVRDGNIIVSNQVISGFNISNSKITAAHTPIAFNWNELNNFTLCLKLYISNIENHQLVATWRTVSSGDICVNDIRINNKQLQYEYSVAEGSINIPSVGWYTMIFNKTAKCATLQLLDAGGESVGTKTIAHIPSVCSQYLYLGVEEDAEVRKQFSWNSWQFLGSIDCKESYIVMNNKKYMLKI